MKRAEVSFWMMVALAFVVWLIPMREDTTVQDAIKVAVVQGWCIAAWIVRAIYDRKP